MAYPTSDPLPFPALRKEYTTKKNPIFVSDLVVLNKQLFTGLKLLLGLPDSGATAFAIISGMTYTPGSPGSYNSGFVYMNGNFYYFSGTLTENKYLKPDLRNSTPKKFQDGSTDNLYSDQYCITSDTQVADMPQFVGNMDQYRFNMTAMKGITEGKVPTIGNSWDISALTSINPDGTIVSGAFVGKLHDNIPNIQSDLTTGQIVKVGNIGLVSSGTIYEGKVAISSAIQTITHNLNIPIINQRVVFSIDFEGDIPGAIGGSGTTNVDVNSFQILCENNLTSGGEGTNYFHWIIYDNR